MAYEFRMQRRVEFCETDAAGLMHFSNYFRFMEAAEHAFYRSLGFSVHGPQAAESGCWPRVHASCDYRRALRFEDRVEVHLLVARKEAKTLTYTFIFRRLEGDVAEEVARGSITVIYTRHDTRANRLRAAAIPAAIADMIHVAPSRMLEEAAAG